MPLNEASRRPRRPRWPLEFELAGVPRENALRARVLAAMQAGTSLESALAREIAIREGKPMSPQNSFISDKNQANAADPLASLTPQAKANLLELLLKDQTMLGKEIDLSKPVIKPYNPFDPRNKFPCMVYNHKNGHTLICADQKQLAAAQKRGYQTDPSLEYDYSKLPGGFASKKAAAPLDRVQEAISAEELAAIDEEEEAQGTRR